MFTVKGVLPFLCIQYFLSIQMLLPLLLAENVATGDKLSFQNVGVYDVLTFQKSRGGKSSPRGGQELT